MNPYPRKLTEAEKKLVIWLLECGTPEEKVFLSTVSGLQVTGRCPCGCASVNFSELEPDRNRRQLTQKAFEDSQGNTIGALLFATSDKLIGLEVWYLEGEPVPRETPDPDVLRCID
jgi:hypothetical protein